ncbi:MAG: TlpA family protein disulfide reductase [bacterium]|nr:TlpA family protein disulfide reductase [bacterium]
MRVTQCLLATIIALVALPGCKPRKAPPPPLPLPEINAARWLNTDVHPVSLASLKGKVVVLEFWATWCPPCRASIPHLVELHEKYKHEGVVIIALTDEDYDRANIGEFIKTMNMSYIVGTGSSSARDYGVRGIPHTVVIGKDGQLVWRGHPMSGLDQAIEAALGRASLPANNVN